ncbi:MAG: type II secretion system F family protein, partial [Planctomycetes bacterium]|nr:type II secretion system F family protein [Planctomycetota bacterium]
AAGDRALHAALQRRGIRLSPLEDTVLAASWKAGTAAASLRARAVERRRRAEFQRTVWAGLRYPLLLAGMILLASVATMAIVGKTMLVVVLTAYAAIAGSTFLLRRAARTGAPWVTRLPVLGKLLLGLGELPYLESLHGLYGAGVPILQANTTAVRTVHTAAVRERLLAADRVLQGGRRLGEALHQTGALHEETRSLLATGEQAGQLEDALRRALERRRQVVATEVQAAARLLGNIAYAVAAGAVVVIVFQFYSSLYGNLGRSGGR